MQKFESSFGIIELTDERESHIYEFHPEIHRYKKYFANTLLKPDVTRRSKFDSTVLIFYHAIPKKKTYLAIVIKTNHRNFVLTAYLTERIQHQPL